MIKLENVSYKYENYGTALHDISLEIADGEFTAVLGHNGSGKSTLAKLFNAVLTPTTGKVYVKGMDTSDENLTYQIRQNVGMVFQNPDNQIVATIVEEDVAFGPENLGIPPEEIRRRTDEALKEVDMYEYRKKAPHLLSGGQKQRIAIAGVIAMQPSCIVLDEPTAMLDPEGRKEVMKTIQRLNRELGLTIVLITHYMDEAAMAKRVIVIDHGHITMDGEPAQVLTKRDELRRAGLDVPQVTELIEEIRMEGVRCKPVINVDDCVAELCKLLQKGGKDDTTE